MTTRSSLAGIPVQIVRSLRRVKTISIQVQAHGVTVRVPARTPQSRVDALLRDRAAWIEQQWNEAQRTKLSSSRWRPDALRLLDTPLTLRYTHTPDIKTWKMHYAAPDLHISGPAPDVHDEAVKEVIYAWYKSTARTHIQSKVHSWAQRLGLTYQSIRIKEQKSRWGSCSQAGNLNFNWRLIMAPDFVLEYVVVHELCHLQEMNHSERFWSLVNTAFPRAQEAKVWLRNHGSTLHL